MTGGRQASGAGSPEGGGGGPPVRAVRPGGCNAAGPNGGTVVEVCLRLCDAGGRNAMQRVGCNAVGPSEKNRGLRFVYGFAAQAGGMQCDRSDAMRRGRTARR